MVRRFNSRVPMYPDDADYTTNAPSYYDDLARKNKLIKVLAEKIGHYDEELAKRFKEWDKLIEELPDELKRMLQEWFDDGTLAEILAELMLEDYATIEWVKDWVNEKFDTNNDIIKKLIDDLKEKLDNKSVTYIVGDNSDFKKLQEALDYIDDLPIKPKKVKITFEEDFILNEQVNIVNKNFNFVEIYSSKPVNMKPDQSYIDEWCSDEYSSLFYCKNSNLPVIDTMFKYIGDKTGEYKNISGMYLEKCDLLIKGGNGFSGFPNNGIYAVNGCNIVANSCNFSNNGSIPNKTGNGFHIISSQLNAIETNVNKCGNDGFNFYSGSFGNVSHSTGNGCGHHGLNATQSCVINALGCEFKDVKDNAVVAFSNTQIDLRNSICTNSTNSAVVSQNGSHISFDNGDVSGSGFDGLQVKHGASISFDNGKSNNNKQGGCHLSQGMLFAYDAEFNKNGREGIRGNGGIAQLYNCTINGNKGDNINARVGASIKAINCTINDGGKSGCRFSNSEMIVNDSTINNNGEYGLHSTAGGKANASNCTINGSSNTGVYTSGGEINCTGSTIKNSGNYAVQALRGGQIIAYKVSASGSKNVDFAVSSSATIQASESTGTANRKINDLTHNGYILSNTLTYNE